MNFNEKIDRVLIINSRNNIKEYNLDNKNMRIEDIINNINKKLNKENHIKRINQIYFKYKSKYDNLDEILKTNEKIRNIFLNELENELDNIKDNEKEIIINNTKRELEKNKIDIDNYLDFNNLFNFFILNIPQLILDTTLKGGKSILIILNNNFIKKVKENMIERVKEELKINLIEINEKEYTELKKEMSQNNNNNELLKELERLKKENELLKKENEKLRLYSNNIIKEVDKIKENFILYDNFIKNELLIILQKSMKRDLKMEEKEKLKQDLKLKSQLLNNFKPF